MLVSTMYNWIAIVLAAALAGLQSDGSAPFYTKRLDAAGLPVIASARAPDEALAAARDIVTGMLAHRPDLARHLVRQGYRVAVMAAEESTTDLPEQSAWTRPAADDPRLTGNMSRDAAPLFPIV